MPRYVRLPTVVDAIQLEAATNLGDVGSWGIDDWVIQDVTGAISGMTSNEFAACFTLGSQSSALMGYDIANTFPTT